MSEAPPTPPEELLLRRFDELAKKLEDLERRLTPQRHVHQLQLSSSNENEAYCVDCGARFYRLDGFDSILDLLKRSHTHDGRSFLECPACRPKFLNLLKDLGYEVRDYGREIRIRRR